MLHPNWKCWSDGGGGMGILDLAGAIRAEPN